MYKLLPHYDASDTAWEHRYNCPDVPRPRALIPPYPAQFRPYRPQTNSYILH